MLQELAYAFRSELCLLGGYPLRSADHQQMLGPIELN
jgi:hypothetical protein